MTGVARLDAEALAVTGYWRSPDGAEPPVMPVLLTSLPHRW